jgi:hypothetical protein
MPRCWKKSRLCGITILISLLLLARPAASQDEPTFRTQSNLVLVPALVRDKTGEIVYGLQAKDFIIEDNGVAQTVHLDEAAEAEPVSLVVAVQCGRRADYELPRMHGLGLMLQPLMAQPETKVAIVAFDSQVHAIEDFTGNENVVTRDLEGLQAGDGGAAILDELFHQAARRRAQESQARAAADQRNPRSWQPFRNHRRCHQGAGEQQHRGLHAGVLAVEIKPA